MALIKVRVLKDAVMSTDGKIYNTGDIVEIEDEQQELFPEAA